MKSSKFTIFLLLFAMVFSVAGLAGCDTSSSGDGGQTPGEGQIEVPGDGQTEEPGDGPEEPGSGGLLDRDFPYINDADDAPVEPEKPFDDSQKYTYSYAFRTVSGSMAESDGVYTAGTANSMAVDNTTPFPYGTISCTVRSNNQTDSGIVFGLTESGASTYWESGVSYYFFFLGRGGNAYLGKVDGGWKELKVVGIGAIDADRDYTLKVVLRSNKICCYVDDTLMFGYKDEDFLTGTCYGLRAGAAGVTFSDVSVTNEYLYE